MKKVFVDTNIIVDLLADRRPHSKFAIELFKKAERNEVELFTSSHSIATSHYLLKKYINEKQLRSILLSLLDYITVVPIDQESLIKGLRSKHKDFEDALQMLTAESVNNMLCIVTRNIKDFKLARVKVVGPDEVIAML